MQDQLKQIKQTLDRRRGQLQLLQQQIDEQRIKVRNLMRERRYAEQAQVVIQTVAQATQKELEYHVSDIVSLALAAVFDDPYELRVEFVMRRNKTEADLLFERRGQRCDPVGGSGGGAVDVASFALRMALWMLRKPRTRNVILLDEPFKHLSHNLQQRAVDMLQGLSQRLGLQIIMVSHVPDLIESADRVFQVSMVKGVSEVR